MDVVLESWKDCLVDTISLSGVGKICKLKQNQMQNVSDIESPPARAAVHRNAAIFVFIRAFEFDHVLLSQNFHDNISNGSGVIPLTDTHTRK